MAYIELRRLGTDSDEMVQLEVTASNDRQLGTQDFYVYPDELTRFGQSLQRFPTSISDVVSLEYGQDPKFYAYVKLCAVVLNARGHSALEIRFDNRGLPPARASCAFYISCEPASINRFGHDITTWSKNMTDVLRVEFTPP